MRDRRCAVLTCLLFSPSALDARPLRPLLEAVHWQHKLPRHDDVHNNRLETG